MKQFIYLVLCLLVSVSFDSHSREIAMVFYDRTNVVDTSDENYIGLTILNDITQCNGVSPNKFFRVDEVKSVQHKIFDLTLNFIRDARSVEIWGLLGVGVTVDFGSDGGIVVLTTTTNEICNVYVQRTLNEACNGNGLSYRRQYYSERGNDWRLEFEVYNCD